MPLSSTLRSCSAMVILTYMSAAGFAQPKAREEQAGKTNSETQDRTTASVSLTDVGTFDDKAIVVVRTKRVNAFTRGNGFVFGDSALVATPFHLVTDVSETGEHMMFLEPLVISPYYGDAYEARIVGSSPALDLAILQVSWPGHPALELANENEMSHAGETIVIAYEKKEVTQTPSLKTSERLPLSVHVDKEGVPLIVVQQGKTEVLGKGWSGAPIISVSNGRAVGMFNGFIIFKEQGISRPYGCAASRIADCVRGQIRRPACPPLSKKSEQIIQDHPEKAFAKAFASTTTFAAQDFEASVVNSQDFAKLRPESPLAHLFVAESASRAGKIDLAEEHFRTALDLDTRSRTIHFGYARFLEEIGQKEEAVKEYSLAHGIDPDSIPVVLNLISVLLDTGKAEEAEELGQDAVKKNPQNAYLWTNYANALLVLGKTDKGIQALSTAVGLKPEMTHIVDILTNLRKQAGLSAEERN